MRKLVITVLLAALILLCGCDSEGSGGGLYIYRVFKPEYQTAGELISVEELKAAPGLDDIPRMLSVIAAEPSDSRTKSILPNEVIIVSYEIFGTEFELTLSEGYLDLEGMEKTLTDYCLALSLCSISGIESVTILVGDEVVSVGLTANDALLYDTEENPYERQLRLYFVSSDGRYLTSEHRTLFVEGDPELERYVIEELLRGPNDDTLTSPIPEGTQLISVTSEEGFVTVNLSAEFLTGKADSFLGERLTLLSIVNSLTSLAEIQGVSISVDGEPLTQYGYHALSEPLTRNENAIGPANSAKGEEDVNIYYRLSSGIFVAVPRIVVASSYGNLAEAVVAAVVEGTAEPVFETLFPDDCEYSSVFVDSGVCTVDFPSGFFALFDSQSGLEAALQSLYYALSDLRSVTTIHFTERGDAPQFNGESIKTTWVRYGEVVE